GYDYVISIEHEDAIMSIEEGFQRAVQNLQQVILREPLKNMWWV
ncbi:sugar phosphate isomerase/epimerase, partial [Mesorhizobium sp. M00.F.Ca.ET.186.01.1.1]